MDWMNSALVFACGTEIYTRICCASNDSQDRALLPTVVWLSGVPCATRRVLGPTAPCDVPANSTRLTASEAAGGTRHSTRSRRQAHRTVAPVWHANDNGPAQLTCPGRFPRQPALATSAVRLPPTDPRRDSIASDGPVPAALPVGSAIAPGRASTAVSAARRSSIGVAPCRAQNSALVRSRPAQASSRRSASAKSFLRPRGARLDFAWANTSDPDFAPTPLALRTAASRVPALPTLVSNTVWSTP